MTLGEKQRVFTVAVARLILEAQRRGYGLTFGEAYRTPEQAALNARTGAGIAKSLHTLRLAVDLNLFLSGVYLDDSEAHRPLGEWWEAQSTPGLTFCWGGRFSRPDGNHYSLEHQGIR